MQNVITNSLKQPIYEDFSQQKSVPGTLLHHQVTVDSNLLDLPVEVWLSIFQFLGSRDICRVSMTCKAWKQIAEDSTVKNFSFFLRQPQLMIGLEQQYASSCSMQSCCDKIAFECGGLFHVYHLAKSKFLPVTPYPKFFKIQSKDCLITGNPDAPYQLWDLKKIEESQEHLSKPFYSHPSKIINSSRHGMSITDSYAYYASDDEGRVAFMGSLGNQVEVYQGDKHLISINIPYIERQKNLHYCCRTIVFFQNTIILGWFDDQDPQRRSTLISYSLESGEQLVKQEFSQQRLMTLKSDNQNLIAGFADEKICLMLLDPTTLKAMKTAKYYDLIASVASDAKGLSSGNFLKRAKVNRDEIFTPTTDTFFYDQLMIWDFKQDKTRSIRMVGEDHICDFDVDDEFIVIATEQEWIRIYDRQSLDLIYTLPTPAKTQSVHFRFGIGKDKILAISLDDGRLVISSPHVNLEGIKTISEVENKEAVTSNLEIELPPAQVPINQVELPVGLFASCQSWFKNHFPLTYRALAFCSYLVVSLFQVAFYPLRIVRAYLSG